jgi:hypothetical protein
MLKVVRLFPSGSFLANSTATNRLLFALGADAVMMRGEDTHAQRDYWQYPKTSGIAIKYTN